MLFSGAVTRRRLIPRIASSVLLSLAVAALAQEAPPDEETPQVAIVGSGVGVLATASGSLPLAYALSASGPLVDFEPLVARLGGRLETGPLGQSYTLALGETSYVLVPGSAALTSGTEIYPLSQPPQTLDGRLFVSIDLLEKTYGTTLGVGFAWDGASFRLAASLPASRELPLEVDLVHLQGVTTLVLRFPEAPRYRIVRTANGYDVILQGDRLLPPPRFAPAADALLEHVDLAADRVRLALAPEAQAEFYTLANPFRLVFDIFRAAPSSATAATAPRESLRRGIRTVVLDPGHGGKETGALGPAGSAEKEITLLIAKALAPRLEQALGVKVVLTRDDDVDLALDERSALANQNKADLFVSIHLNSSYGRTARGAETYFLSLQASDQRAADAAAAENYAGTGRGTDGNGEEFQLQLLLWDLAQSQHLAQSQRLARLIQEELNQQLDLKDRGVKQAPFRVLMGAAMPAVLVELGFISTREEEERLRTPEYRGELVETLVRAIGRFKAEVEQRSDTRAAGP